MATATKTAVQVAWDETAFSAMEIPSIPEPATNVHPEMVSDVYIQRCACKGTLTEKECSSQDNLACTAAQQPTHIVDTVDLTMAELEDTDDIVGPGCNAADEKETDHAGDDTEGIEGDGN